MSNITTLTIKSNEVDLEGPYSWYRNILGIHITDEERGITEKTTVLYFYRGVLFALMQTYEVPYDNGKVTEYFVREAGPCESHNFPNMTTERKWEADMWVKQIKSNDKLNMNRFNNSLRLKTQAIIKDLRKNII